MEAVAVAFAVLPSIVDKVIMGMKSSKEVSNNMAAVADVGSVPPTIWKEAQDIGLLRADVPLP